MKLQVFLKVPTELGTLQRVVDLQSRDSLSQSLQLRTRHLQQLLVGIWGKSNTPPLHLSQNTTTFLKMELKNEEVFAKTMVRRTKLA